MKMNWRHDYHVHSRLSKCAAEHTDQTPENIYAFALAHGYDSICLTDHMWDAAVPGASHWYESQTEEWVRQSLPLPEGDIPFFFGCEGEFVGGDRLSVSPEALARMDFVPVALNHFHMPAYVSPEQLETPQMAADLFASRLEDFSRLDLPWEKIGIAHPTCKLIVGHHTEYTPFDVFDRFDLERMRPVFRDFAAKGAGIELNGSSLALFRDAPESVARIFVLARDCGCKFYCGSDAHSLRELASVEQSSAPVVEYLELREEDRYRIPTRK